MSTTAGVIPGLIGDPFSDEHTSENVVYGKDITEERSIFPFDQLCDVAPCKSNHVSFMKIEELNRSCRNIVAVTELYVCYSVTQKRNILRLIDLVSGEKAILRGHDTSILDIQVSPIDKSTFCSVDASTNSTPAVIVWKNPHLTTSATHIEDDKKLAFVHQIKLPLAASLVGGHPKLSHVWFIAHGNHLALFSTTQPNIDKILSYNQLSAHIVVTGQNITDAVFTADGRHIVCVIDGALDSAYVQVFRISKDNHHEHYNNKQGGDVDVDEWTGQEKLYPVFTDYSSQLHVPRLLAVHHTQNVLITAARNDNCSLDNNDIAYELKFWKHSLLNGNEPPVFLQSVIIGLPQHVFNSKIPSSSLINPSLEIALHVIQNKTPFVLLSSRKSSYVAYLALAPVTHTGLPAYHVTLWNLKAPVVSLDATTIVGREHFSPEEGEHVELSCFQEDASSDLQASIQQYRGLNSALAESFEAYPLKSQLSSRSRSSRQSPLPSAVPSNSFGESLGSAGLESTSKKSTILDMLNKGSSGLPSFLTAGSNSTPVQSNMDFQPSVLTVDRHTLQELSASSSMAPVAPAEASPAPAPVPFTPTMKKIDSSALFGRPLTQTTASPVPIPAVSVSSPAPAAVAPSQSSEKLLSALRVPPASAATSTATATMSLAMNAPAASPSKLSSMSAEDRELLTSAAHAIGTSASKAKPASAHAIAVELPTVASIIPSAESSAQFVPKTELVSSDANNVLLELRNELRLLQQERTKERQEMSQWKEEMLIALINQSTRSADSAAKQVKTHLEVENKKLASAIASSRQDLSAQMMETIQQKVLPSLREKIAETTRESIRDTVSRTLADSFRTSFESSLLPAFQAGIDRLFAQVNASFEAGLKAFVEDIEVLHDEHSQSHEALEVEVQSLKNEVIVLQETIRELSSRVQSTSGLSSGSSMAAGSATNVEKKLTPMELLSLGKIADAVRLALEEKDIEQTTLILSKLTAQQVNGTCSNVVRLCLAQQLAADMSVNIPKEGLAARIQWIKNLVLSLVRIPASEVDADAILSKNFKIMIHAVLESIRAAKSLIERAQFDDGEDNAVEIPHSVEIDLQLLECVIQSKI